MSIATDVAQAGDRERTIVGMVVARTWRDPVYRERFLQAPKAVLADEGFEMLPEVEILVVEDTPTVRYVCLAPETTEVEQVISVLRRAIPAEPGHELRLVRSTEHIRYLALPMPPAEPQALTESELSRRAAQDVGVVIAVNAEAELSATTTTDLAEAEAVAIAVLT